MAKDILTVTSQSMTPTQHRTSTGFKRHADCYERYMIKFADEMSVFHSLAELYHALLLESDPSVFSYVPQPFRLRVGKKVYVPDCFLVRNGERVVVELKPGGRFDEKLKNSLTVFFARYAMRFEVLDNERFLEQSLLAQNWMTIVSLLHTGKFFLTDVEEVQIVDHLSLHGPQTLEELIDPGNRIGTMPSEVALFRLLHRGVVSADLSNAPLDYDTEFRLCM